jgi:hypothetical protein
MPHDRREHRDSFRGLLEHVVSRPNGRCGVCGCAARVQIELLLAGGASQRAVSRKYRLSHHALSRHWAGHVSEERKANLVLGPVQRHALAARVAEESSSVIDQLRVVRAGLFQTYDAALTAGDRLSIASIAGRLHENMRIAGGITGELASSPLVQINNQTNNILINDPAFAAFQADLIRVLSRFPQARDAVLAEFERLEAVPSDLPALEHQSDAETEA